MISKKEEPDAQLSVQGYAVESQTQSQDKVGKDRISKKEFTTNLKSEKSKKSSELLFKKKQKEQCKKNEQKEQNRQILMSDYEIEEKPKKQEHNETSKKQSMSKYHYKQLLKREKLQQAERKAQQVSQSLIKAFDEDVILFSKKKPAKNKLICIQKVATTLKQLLVAKIFMSEGGLMILKEWLLPYPQNGQETCLTVKLQVFKLILDLQVTAEDVQNSSSLEKVIKSYKKSKFSDLRRISSEITNKWKLALANQKKLS